MNSTYFNIAVMAFGELSAEERADFMNERLVWASTCNLRDEIKTR